VPENTSLAGKSGQDYLFSQSYLFLLLLWECWLVAANLSLLLSSLHRKLQISPWIRLPLARLPAWLALPAQHQS
jgi:hypothetical protein